MTTKAVRQAIDTSCSFNEIVTIDHDDEDVEALLAECEDSADADVLEFWGTRADGVEWRVHVKPS